MRSQLITPRVVRWLQNGRPARILHRFEQVCNLIDDQGQVISLAASPVGPGPFTMLLDSDHLPPFDAQSPVRYDPLNHSLSVGSWSICIDYTNIWDARPRWDNLREYQMENWDWAAPPRLPADIEQHLHQLLQGITDDDDTMCRAAAYELAGRGNGLTPVGDDVLLGVLYGLWTWEPALKWINLIVEAAVPCTTSLSAAFLRAAAAGEATIHWHRLANGEATAVEQILSIGHTSGRDAWAGFIHAGKILRNRVSSNKSAAPGEAARNRVSMFEKID